MQRTTLSRRAAASLPLLVFGCGATAADHAADVGDGPPPQIYANTADTLYVFDPAARTLAKVGKLSCLTPTEKVLDIAIDGSGRMYATTWKRLLSVDPATASCAVIRASFGVDELPNSLSFVARGTAGPEEALVGYAYDADDRAATAYVRVDPATGEVTRIGSLNDPTASTRWACSGDVASPAHDAGASFVTVKRLGGSASDDADMLAEIDPKTGRLRRVVGATERRDVYGLVYWGGKGYGFAFDGGVLEIEMSSGSSELVVALQPDALGGWFGAAAATTAR